MNDELYEQQTIGDWVFSVLVSIGAVTAFVVALAVTL